MSRTRRGDKGPGHDYWSRRPHTQKPIGRETKKLTAKAERQQAHDDIALGFEEMNAKLREPCPCCHGYCNLDPWACEQELMALEHFRATNGEKQP